MAVGTKIGFEGDSVPLHGNSEIRQASSANDVLTITLNSSVSSTTGGRGLAVNRSTAGGVSTEAGPFAVEYDGVWGRRHVKSLAHGGATTYTVASSDSGCLFVVPACASALIVTLPAVAAGLWYEFYTANACASGVVVQGAATGLLVVALDAAADSIQWGATGIGDQGGSLRVVSDGTKWYTITQPAYSSAALSSAVMTDWDIVS